MLKFAFIGLLCIVIGSYAAEVQPKRDSFYVIDYAGFSQNDLILVVNDAEQAKSRYPGNLNALGSDLRSSLNSRFGNHFSCTVIKGPIHISYWYGRYYVVLVSDSGDNMNIDCWQGAKAFDENGNAVEAKLRV